MAGTLTICDNFDWNGQELKSGDLLVSATLSCMLATYHMWRRNELREIAYAHEIRVYARDTAQTLVDRLGTHVCGRCCPTVIVIFRLLQRSRTEMQVERQRNSFQFASQRHPDAYGQVADDELRRSIIQEWQDTINTDKFQLLVCGPCGRRTDPSQISLVSCADFDLTLLRNDALPDKVKPSTYNLVAYKEALLNPKGLVDRWQVGNVRMCEACRRDLVERRRMPKLSLANWLYYAVDELPEDAKRAFKSSTFTERRLIGRAMCSRISYRFTELRRRTEDDADGGLHPESGTQVQQDASANVHSRSQRCIKGNVLVMPQNSTQLTSVLPPSPEVIRDTLCAVFVCQTKPTRDNIGKLGPLLVRKSRLITMINFMTQDNPHYACDTDFHGYSQRNMDILFGPGTEGQDEGVPCALEVGFIQDSEAIRASVAGSVDREAVEDDPTTSSDELLMENVGYTMGDESPVSYRDMKMKALSQCLSGGRFLRSQGGDKFMPDFENPSLLTWLFPHLDPWGIGGFHEPAREVSVSMEEQLKYLLELDDSPFERDPDFAFVYYNILQKKAVCDSVRFRVKVADQARVIRDLLSINKDELEHIIGRFKSNSNYEPETPEQRQMVDLVNKVGTMLHDLPGTAGYKMKMRNEIQSLVNMRGTPAFFITLNPSDVNHPLVRLLSGDNIRLEQLEEGQALSDWDRMLLVARNPGACAKFFHTMISSFINIVLRYGKQTNGLFGKCTAYYGTVEAQGRGTLHCHMLIWLEGHPSPQEMRDLMVNSEQYQADMFTWLESLIKCELLGTTMTVSEPHGAIPRPKYDKSPPYVNPGTTLGPSISDTPPHEFWLRFASDVNDIVTHTNWHQHTETCWKNLRRGEPWTDDTCRMRIDGRTREQTTIDQETGSILLRRLHPRIANYNDLIIFLLRANMDIKHIGSGEAAKALIYYVTDYITKASLPTHVGLSALLYAINRTATKFKDIPNWPETRSTGALTVLVNSMMARQEISHQQVMSYLVGGGDHYTSDKFRVLHYASFERLVTRHWLTGVDGLVNPNADHRSDDNDTTSNQSEMGNPGLNHAHLETVDITPACFESLRRADDGVTLLLGAGSISAVNQQQDYLYRPHDEPFNSMGLYEYTGMTEKTSKDAESRRILRRHETPASHRPRGRPQESRGELPVQHPQHATHLIRKRTVWIVPVLLGERMARPDRSDEERERWARTVLTLFVPWRHPSDLKDELETWYDAYERHSQDIAAEHMSIIHNMNVLSECRDARDKANLCRKMTRQPVAPLTSRPSSPDPYNIFEPTCTQQISPDHVDNPDNATDVREMTLMQQLDKNIGTRCRHAIDKCFSQTLSHSHQEPSQGTATLLTGSMQADVDADHNTMRRLKRKRRPEDNSDLDSNSHRHTRPRLNLPPVIAPMQLPSSSSETLSMSRDIPSYDTQDIVNQVVIEQNLQSNPEQLRAFEIVSNHLINGGCQLTMYIGGVGGTGKSHVVNSILRLFQLLGKRNNVLVAAPTGAAALLIGGHTIHSLTMLPDTPGRDFQELCNIWDGVDYLILDEISMVGARFLSQLNARLIRAKGLDEKRTDQPFGGVNIIFTGDFGQLRPVRDPPLYSHMLVNNPALDDCQHKNGISALMGVFLWRKVNTVVLLRINQRQAGDKVYADMLSRIRVGQAKTSDSDGSPSDFTALRSRYTNRLDSTDSQSLSHFQDSPIIVGRKKIRDLLNIRIMGHFASRLNVDVHIYHSRDKIAGEFVSVEERQYLWKVSSTLTHDSLGKLPLFPGMVVMVQENLAFSNRVVNGSQGIVKDIIYEEQDGLRYPTVVYVHIPGSGSICANAPDDIVPIFPEWTSFRWTRIIAGQPTSVSVSRLQLPLLPAYAYTDYKSQGRSLATAIVDPSSASTLQGVYVMLSRVKALQGLAILRPFKAAKIEQRLSQELRTELNRLEELDTRTRHLYRSSYS